jgi:diaminopimelate decarboxylase
MAKMNSLAFRENLTIQNGRLVSDGLPCDRLAKEYGTPLYVLSEDKIRNNFRAFRAELAKIYDNVLVTPACKANSHLAVCRIYQSEGAGLEVVSGAELRIALDVGVDPEKIVYNGPLKSREEMELAISSGVGLINADSLPELDHLQEVAHRVGKRADVGIRVNMGIEAETHPSLLTALREQKFGIWVEDALAAYKEAANKHDLNVIGAHSHIGSNIFQPEIFSKMSKALLRLVSEVNETLGLKLTKIDMGGGLGFPYEPNSNAMSYGEYASAILSGNLQTLRSLGNPRLIFEPGRAIVADAGFLLTRVDVVKRQGDINWAIVDAGMNTFIRPALYGAKHQVVPANRMSDPMTLTYDIGGPCCESADVIAKSVQLPKLCEGDLLAVLDTGAYGFTMASNYNGQPRPAVILTTHGQSDVIRSRESYEDLIAKETIPPHLATDRD